MGNSVKSSSAALLERLEPPAAKVAMVLDTDTYNEIDDQFAVAYAMLSPASMEVEAIYAAPFHNSRSSGPGDGMEKSYEEIVRVLDRLGREAPGLAHKGSGSFMAEAETPVDSPAAQDLIRRAMANRDGPLYVVAIGAPTNVASAILIEPRIVERIVVVWLGGHPHTWHDVQEFNFRQDLHATRVLFDSGVPFMQIPCFLVAEQLRTTLAELEVCIKSTSAIGDYLFGIFRDYHDDHFAWSKVLWDISAIGWLVDAGWFVTELVPSPIITDQCTYSRDGRRHLMRVATHVDRDGVFRDLFTKIRSTA
jgi:inosine-uridine nucleoside N-ribohydrolase